MALPPSLKKKTGRNKVSNHYYSALRLVLACAMGVFISQLKLDSWEAGLYDLRIRLLPEPKTSGHIEMIITTSQTVEGLRGLPTAKDQTKLLQSLEREEPLAVLYTHNFDELQGTLEEKTAFAEEAQKFTNLFVIAQEQEMKGEEGKLKLPPPLETIPLFSGPRTVDKVLLAQDDVTRRMIITYQERQRLHPYIAAILNPQVADMKNIRGLFDFFDTEQVYIQ
jgi:hypothetical protein